MSKSVSNIPVSTLSLAVLPLDDRCDIWMLLKNASKTNETNLLDNIIIYMK